MHPAQIKYIFPSKLNIFTVICKSKLYQLFSYLLLKSYKFGGSMFQMISKDTNKFTNNHKTNSKQVSQELTFNLKKTFLSNSSRGVG